MKKISKESNSIENNKFIDIQLTDIQLHVIKPRKPISLGRAIDKSLKSKKGGRAQSRDISNSKNNEFTFSISLGKELLEKAKQEGKQIRFILPESGISIIPGKDMIEYIKAQKKKVFDKTGN
ncbi:MAG: hypothetical protein WA055_04720 [Candidatus Moraniibacteriota bacterium]